MAKRIHGCTRNKLNNQSRFLFAFSKLGLVGRACVEAGITRTTFNDWMKEDEAFVRRFSEAEELVSEMLIAEMMRRGVEGWNEPVYYQGQQCGVVRKYSDPMLTLALKSRMPEKFRERYETRITKSDDEIDSEIQRELATLAASGPLALPGTDQAIEGTSRVVEESPDDNGGSNGSAKATTPEAT